MYFYSFDNKASIMLDNLHWLEWSKNNILIKESSKRDGWTRISNILK